MTNELMWIKDWYWAYRDVVRAAAAVGAIGLFHVGLLLWTTRRLRELSHIRERMSRLADGLALLTDTTEAGLATLIREVEQLGKRRTTTARAATRTDVARRVVAAAKNGTGLGDIAEAESLSESEVRLHLTLAQGLEKGLGLKAYGSGGSGLEQGLGLKAYGSEGSGLAARGLGGSGLAARGLGIQEL